VTFCCGTMMNTFFQFSVTDTFLIEGRGLIISPFFPLDQYRFDGEEQVRIETPDGRLFEAEADVEIPHIKPAPKVPQAMFVLRGAQKADVPIGSKVSLPGKTAELVNRTNTR
jgi:hypothetical protein